MNSETNADDEFPSPATRLNQINGEDSLEKEFDENEEPLQEHGTPDGIGYWGSVAHIVRSTVGTGILILPLVMKHLGYITGTFLLLAVSLIYFHVLHIFLHLDSRLRKHFKLKRLTYALMVDKILLIAPSPFRECRTPMQYVIYVYYIVPTSEAMTLIIISTNIQQMAKYHGIDLDFTIIVTCLSLILTIFCMFKSILKILVPFSSASNICSFAIAILIMVYSTIYRDSQANVRPFAGDTNLILRGMAVYFNSVLSTEVILPINNGMKKPEKMLSYFGSLNVSAFIITVFYAAFAATAYINLGDNIQENILSNIPISNWLMLSINLAYSLALAVPYVLFFYASFDVLWKSKLHNHLADSKCKYIVEYGIRFGYNAFAYVLAIGVSNLALISAVAGVLAILLDVAIMPFLQILLMYALKERNLWIICRNILLCAFCSILFLLSMIDCVTEIAKLHVF